jgi:NIMA (never in mitosis gene a)-related kinase
MSPEMYENKPYTHKSDIWALGCILYELCTLERAFNAKNLASLVFKIIKDDVKSIPNTYTKELNALVLSILNKNPYKRPGMR